MATGGARSWQRPSVAAPLLCLVTWCMVISPLAEAAAEVSASPPCVELSLSPQFKTDNTAYCSTLERGDNGTVVELFRTIDGGRSWSKAAANGLVVSADEPFPPTLLVSPMYADDQTLYVGLSSSGLFASNDRGDSFSLVDLLGGYEPVPFITATPHPILGPLRRVSFLQAISGGAEGANRSVMIDPITHLRTPVKGTPGFDRAFTVSPYYEQDGLAYAVGEFGAGLTRRFDLFRCNAVFSCDEKLFSLPDRWVFERIWFAPDFAESKGLFISARDLLGGMGTSSGAHVWRSDDAGTTFAPWISTQKILDRFKPPETGTAGRRILGIAGVPGTSILYMYVYAHNSGIEPGFPRSFLYRSKNNGGSWKLAASGTATDNGNIGTLPVIEPSHHFGISDTPLGFVIAPTPEKVLLVGFDYRSASSPDQGVVWCSTNSGRRWSQLCR